MLATNNALIVPELGKFADLCIIKYPCLSPTKVPNDLKPQQAELLVRIGVYTRGNATFQVAHQST